MKKCSISIFVVISILFSNTLRFENTIHVQLTHLAVLAVRSVSTPSISLLLVLPVRLAMGSNQVNLCANSAGTALPRETNVR